MKLQKLKDVKMLLKQKEKIKFRVIMCMFIYEDVCINISYLCWGEQR